MTLRSLACWDKRCSVLIGIDQGLIGVISNDVTFVCVLGQTVRCQMQTQMAVIKNNKCDFIVWTPQAFSFVTVL